MSEADLRVVCETPTPGKKSTRIRKWKYDLVRDAILRAVSEDHDGVEFRRLPELVESHLLRSELQRLGSLSWYVTTVKLDMEVKGELERVPGSRPQRLRKTRGARR